MRTKFCQNSSHQYNFTSQLKYSICVDQNCVFISCTADASLTIVFSVFAAIHEFPQDVFTNDERKSGAVLLHIVAVSRLVVLLYLLTPSDKNLSGVHLDAGGFGRRLLRQI